MGNTIVTGDASSWLGGMSGKARDILKGRKKQLEEQEKEAMGEKPKKKESK